MTLPRNPVRVYAIGDVHGYLDKLILVHRRIARDLAANPPDGDHVILHIGDYTDRGPDSRGVIQFLVDGAARGAPWINLYGNHDRMFLKYLIEDGAQDPRLRAQFYWLHPRLGGRETLLSYGIDVPADVTREGGQDCLADSIAAVPPAHIAFLEGLRTHWHWGDWFFAHAGIRPGVPLDQQIEDDLIWIRGEFHASDDDHGCTIVHGHTPVDLVEDHGNRIAIDTGAAYGGSLSCIVIEGPRVRILDGEPLR